MRRPGTNQGAQPSQSGQTGTPSDQMGQFVAAVLAENEDVWSDILPGKKASPMSTEAGAL